MKVIWIVLFLFFLAIMLKKYADKQERLWHESKQNNYNSIQKYLLDEAQVDKLEHSSKPILWIHVPLEYNARFWPSFGSRSTHDLNQPYLYLTVNSIVRCCDKSFKICIVDDSSFAKLIPNLDINVSALPSPTRDYTRQLLLMKLVRRYGGMIVPISFLCLRNLINLYEQGTGMGMEGAAMFVCENIDDTVSSSHLSFYPNLGFMGAVKDAPVLNELIDFMQRQISADYTAQIDFLGEFDRWCNKRRGTSVQIISGELVGTKTTDGAGVIVDTLLGSNLDVLNFNRETYGIWIPSDRILNRTAYQWFARMDISQVISSNTVIGKYLLLGNTPEAPVIVETLENAETAEEEKKPNWISFWKTPSGVNVWGPKPQWLGNTVPRANN